jgi:hypothetical protein
MSSKGKKALSSEDDLDQVPWHLRDWTPRQYCQARGISKWLFEQYKARGLIRVTYYSPKLHRLTPEDRAWSDAAIRAEAETQAAKLERQRRRQQLKVAAQRSVQSRKRSKQKPPHA